MAPGESHSTQFVTTRWTLVCEAARGGDTDAVEALGALFQTYWPPLYRYVRRRAARSRMRRIWCKASSPICSSSTACVSPTATAGDFVSSCLGSLKHYLANDWEREHRQKRGGFATHVSIDWKDAETGLGLEPGDHASATIHAA